MSFTSILDIVFLGLEMECLTAIVTYREVISLSFDSKVWLPIDGHH